MSKTKKLVKKDASTITVTETNSVTTDIPISDWDVQIAEVDNQISLLNSRHSTELARLNQIKTDLQAEKTTILGL